jgi:hypothetical protein
MPTRFKQGIIEALQELNDEIRRKYKAEIKGIFGSYVRREQKENSDIDILVVFFEGATLFDFVGLADYLEGKLNLKVDIVPIDTLREEIRENILKEAVYI